MGVRGNSELRKWTELERKLLGKMDISSVVEKGVGESTDVSKTRMVSGVLAPRQCRKRLLQFVKPSS